jgi:subtilisin family serine protease
VAFFLISQNTLHQAFCSRFGGIMVTRFLLAALLAAWALCPAYAAEKKRIDKAADVPRFTYKLDGKLEDIVRDSTKFSAFAREYRANVESVLAQYDIADKSTLRNMLSSLTQLDYLEGKYDAALKGVASVRELQDKPADKLLTGLLLKTLIEAQKQAGDTNSDAYRQAVAKSLSTTLDPMEFAVVQNEIREIKANTEIGSESLVLGQIREVLQPTADKAGSLSSDFAPVLVSARYRLLATLPLKQTLIGVYSGYLTKHTVAKKDIWAARDMQLPATGAYSPVTIAIWDSGTDTALFKNQLAMGADGKPLMIAFDKFANPSTGDLYPIPPELKGRLPVMKSRTKGFSDLQSNIDSAEATEVKKYLSALRQDEYKAAIEELRLAGNYMHGTHVAGIATAGNPYAKILTARIEFGHTLIPNPCPSKELSAREAAASQAYVDFFKKHGVRVVNMSWGGSVKDTESELELCGIGKTPEERQKLAREYFDVGKSALTKAFASAPNILFVTSAGNENSDSTFAEAIPAGIVLPNLLTVGAVDLAGDEASFTSYGPTVKVHANGYQVESFIPGGDRVAESGTSMASPQIAGLAGKMLALNPKLTPTELIAKIVSTAEKTADGRRTLVNPKKAMVAASEKR